MSKRTLVVEDQEDLRTILREFLAHRHRGEEWRRKRCEGGFGPDLVLMDIQLPVLDGYDATQQIKAPSDLAAIPVIAVSSFAMKGDEEKARAAGCDDYLTKPYRPSSALAHHPWLSRPEGLRSGWAPHSSTNVNEISFGFGHLQPESDE
jgi:two-component system cell cycle response regulator DivK